MNAMASNLTGQIRNVADVDGSHMKETSPRKITVDVRGEILELKQTINAMVDSLRIFAGEVTRVAKEVGTEESSVVRQMCRTLRERGRILPTT